jgi:glycosyltransferase involved in cell wall biosynthesis
MFVSLIIPAYNEEHRLQGTLDIYERAFGAAYGEAYEILVVANGCSDRTLHVARSAQQRNPHIDVMNIPEPVGKGGAVLAGIERARGERIVFADADAATDADSLLELVAHTDRHDVVIGSRRLDTSLVTRPQPWQRRMLGSMFAWTARTLFGLPFRDTQCGAKAFGRTAACYLAARVQERRWAFDIDLLRWAQAARMDILEHPVRWEDRTGSRLRVLPTAWEIARSFWNMSRRPAYASAQTHIAQASHDA